MLRRWALNVLLAFDQWGNAITGGAPDETISSRAGRLEKKGWRWAKVLCWGLNLIDADHCNKAIENEKRRAHFPEELR
jgi:hypothetical protein